jgi:hypothetical protein
MIDLSGQPAEVRMVLQIKRAATGNTDTIELVGYTGGIPPETKEDKADGSHPLNSGA